MAQLVHILDLHILLIMDPVLQTSTRLGIEESRIRETTYPLVLRVYLQYHQYQKTSLKILKKRNRNHLYLYGVFMVIFVAVVSFIIIVNIIVIIIIWPFLEKD